MAHVAIWLQYVPVNTMTMELQKSCTEKAQISVWAPGFCCGFRWSPTLSLSLSPVSQPYVSGGWTRALRYLHWIHTLYMVSCLPLFTCNRRSTRFCTFSRPASVNISWSSSENKSQKRIKDKIYIPYTHTYTYTHMIEEQNAPYKSSLMSLLLPWVKKYTLVPSPRT